MGRKPADLWRYAERIDKRFKCKFCKQVFHGGVVRLRSHLSGITGQGIQVCNKVLEDVKSAAFLASNGLSKKKSKIETSSSNSDGTYSVISDASCSNEVDTLLANFFEMNDINCSIVESPCFNNLVNALIKYGPKYVLPSSSILKTQLIPSLRREVEQYVSSAKQSWEETGCTLVYDIWCTEKEKRSFISITACSGRRIVLLSTFEIPNKNLTAAFLEGIVHLVVHDVGVDNIVQYIVDDSPCAEVFGKLLAGESPRVFMSRCVVRELQSFFEEVQQEVEWVRTTFEVAKRLVDSICKDDDLLALMRKYTGGKELEQSVSYDMLESIFEVKEELVKLVQSPEWLASGYDQQENGKKATEIIASEEFWKQGEEVQVLKPLSKILYLDEVSGSSLGYLYGLIKVTEEAISCLHSNNPVKYQKLWGIFESKKGQIINETHKAAAFLNPAYMYDENVQESIQMREGINYMLQKVVAAVDEVAFVEQAMHYRQALSNPSERFKIIAAKTSTPCEWWNEFGDEFPVLKKYAIRILSQPCGSSSYKSSLNAFQANLTKQRGLVPELNEFNLRMNHVLMEKFKANNASKRKRINFEEFGKHKSTTGSSNSVLVEARHNDEESRPLITSEELPIPKHLKLCFMTTIASPIFTGQKIERQQGYPIHVYLVDSATDCVVQVGAPSMLTLTISVLDGDFTNEASSDECRTREYFDGNDLSLDMMPLVTGDLQVIIGQGVGTLGDFSFNYSSRGTRSGKFRLAVKTDTGDCEGIRILEGISNAFVVEDDEVTRTQYPTVCEMHLPKDSFSSIVGPMEEWGLEQMLNNSSGSPGDWAVGQIWNNQLQGSNISLTQAAARRVKKKALLWRFRSRSQQGTAKRRCHEPLVKEKRGNEVLEPVVVQSSSGNNVNQQEDGEENDDPMAALKGFDSLNSTTTTTTSAIPQGSISQKKPENPAIMLFGVQVASSGTKEEPTGGETHKVQSPAHPSTALQLSSTGDDDVLQPRGVHSTGRNNVNHQNDADGEKSDSLNSTTTSAIAKAGDSIPLKPTCRVLWTEELHRRFVDAVNQLGNENAFPKTIMQLMNVEGLTTLHIARHLHKYRLCLERMTKTKPGSNSNWKQDKISNVSKHFIDDLNLSHLTLGEMIVLEKKLSEKVQVAVELFRRRTKSAMPVSSSDSILSSLTMKELEEMETKLGEEIQVYIGALYEEGGRKKNNNEEAFTMKKTVNSAATTNTLFTAEDGRVETHIRLTSVDEDNKLESAQRDLQKLKEAIASSSSDQQCEIRGVSLGCC